MPKFTDKLKHAWTSWNAFKAEEEKDYAYSHREYGSNYGFRSDRNRLTISGDRSIVGSIYTRMSIDCAMIEIQHVKKDERGKLVSHVTSTIDECFNVQANIDQAASAFKQDIVMTMFEKGVAAIVPVETSGDPNLSKSYDIKSMRVGEVVAWYPQHVKVSLYDERYGRREEVMVHKSVAAIVENPFYSVMNEPNSVLQRLIRKLTLLDAVDEQTSSGKLDLMIQLPYVIKSQTKRDQAEMRRADIEAQLKNSKYGIAYIDGTERITQLNRPAENNLWTQVQDLTDMLYSHLGLTPEVMNGTANEATMLNYQQRTIKPVLKAVTEAITRSFLTKTARSQYQSIEFFVDPFALVTIANIADIADKFNRNEIMTGNELRGKMGLWPHEDPKADQLQNSNMPVSDTITPAVSPPVTPAVESG